MNRRGLLRGILAAGMAPAIGTTGILMPVRRIWTPPDVLTLEVIQRIQRLMMENRALPEYITMRKLIPGPNGRFTFVDEKVKLPRGPIALDFTRA